MKESRFIQLLIARLMLCIAALSLCQVHVAVTQIYAWGEMIAERTEEQGFSAAVESVVSLDEPCALCHSIAENTQEDETETVSPLRVHLEMKVLGGAETNEFFLPSAEVTGRIAIERTAECAGIISLECPVPPPKIIKRVMSAASAAAALSHV